MITAINSDDGVLTSILMGATSLGSQLADNYDRPGYRHDDGSVRTVKNQHRKQKFVVRHACMVLKNEAWVTNAGGSVGSICESPKELPTQAILVQQLKCSHTDKTSG